MSAELFILAAVKEHRTAVVLAANLRGGIKEFKIDVVGLKLPHTV